MTNREKREDTSTRLRAARALVDPVIRGRIGYPTAIPPGKTKTFCGDCFEPVYVLNGGLRVDEDGGRHLCKHTVHDTDPAPAPTGP